METTENKSQVDGTEVEAQDGATQPMATTSTPVQHGAETAVTPEAETESVESPTPKTYTEDEIRQLQSKYDTEVSTLRQHVSQFAMQQHIAQMEAQERQKDAQQVEGGIITQDEASQRQQTRMTTVRLIQTQKILEQRLEGMARLDVANELGKKYGVPYDKILKDERSATLLGMHEVAADLALKTHKEQIRALQTKRETFDKGQTTSVSGPTTRDLMLRKRYPTMKD